MSVADCKKRQFICANANNGAYVIQKGVGLVGSGLF